MVGSNMFKYWFLWFRGNTQNGFLMLDDSDQKGHAWFNYWPGLIQQTTRCLMFILIYTYTRCICSCSSVLFVTCCEQTARPFLHQSLQSAIFWRPFLNRTVFHDLSTFKKYRPRNLRPPRVHRMSNASRQKPCLRSRPNSAVTSCDPGVVQPNGAAYWSRKLLWTYHIHCNYMASLFLTHIFKKYTHLCFPYFFPLCPVNSVLNEHMVPLSNYHPETRWHEAWLFLFLAHASALNGKRDKL